MYTVKNFKTKKELKEAVAKWNTWQTLDDSTRAALRLSNPVPRPVEYYQPGPFGGNEPQNGTFCVEGPHYPEPHRWYASCTARDGVIVAVKTLLMAVVLLSALASGSKADDYMGRDGAYDVFCSTVGTSPDDEDVICYREKAKKAPAGAIKEAREREAEEKAGK